MQDGEGLVAQVVEAAGGQVVGRVRLQKEFYLLDQLGLGSGFSWAYHHYGPYSADLEDAVDGAKAFGFVDEHPGRRASDGVPFSVYNLGTKAAVAKAVGLGDLAPDVARDALARMQRRSATVLELAATIHWLRAREKVGDWRAELIRRKGSKTEMGRADQAWALLEELALA